MPVPGLVLSIIDPVKGELSFAKGVGNLTDSSHVSTVNLFRIGSITKTFTALTVLQLVEEKKLSLDDSLSKFEARVPNAGQITIRMMLNHTCGIYSYTNDTGFVRIIEQTPLKAWTYEELMAVALRHPAPFLPGQGFGYSNTAYLILGKIIEDVTGNDASAVIKQRVSDRLGLKSTVMAVGPDITGAVTHGYTYDLGGGMKDITRQEVGSWGWTAGGLISDWNDLKLCGRAFATGSLLGSAMRAEYLNWIPVPVSPGTPQDSYTGLGIVRYKDVIGNSGGTYGYTSWVWYMPSNGATLIAFFNQTSTFTESREVQEQQLLAGLFLKVLDVMRQ